MGVRHLTIVKMDGKNVVAQYGQWDGQPIKCGKTIIEFLHGSSIETFKEQLKKVEFLTEENNMDEYLLNCYEQIGVEKGREDITYQEEEKFAEVFPELWRDIGAEILNFILVSKKEKLFLLNNSEFENNVGSCAFIHTLDLDKDVYSISSKGITIFSTSISKPIDENEFLNICEKNKWF